MRKPNATKKNMRREEILAAAAALFAEKNYHEVLISDVAKKANLAKGSIYNYFSTKEDLYISIITHRLELLLNLLKKRVDEQTTPFINLRRIIIHTFSFMVKYPHFFQIWYKEKLNCGKSSHNEIRDHYREIQALLVVAIEKVGQQSSLKQQDEQFIAEMILGMIDSGVLMSQGKTASSQRRIRTQVLETIMLALGTEIDREILDATLQAPGKEREIPFVFE